MTSSFRIQDYIWSIFEIAEAHGISDLETALDMFIANIELSYERYKGASSINYKKIYGSWNNLGEYGKNRQRRLFCRMIKILHIRLFEAWSNKDVEEFVKLCNII